MLPRGLWYREILCFSLSITIFHLSVKTQPWSFHLCFIKLWSSTYSNLYALTESIEVAEEMHFTKKTCCCEAAPSATQRRLWE